MAKAVNKGVWVIIPAYNESKHISEVIKSSKKYAENIVVVDDDSKDSTYDIAKSCNITVLKHIVNLGKGAALKTGCDYAYSKGAETFVVLDADGQHKPEDIPRFLERLKDTEKDVDIVFGYRELDKKMPVVLRLGNNILNFITRLLYNLQLNDTQCGYRAFKREIYKKIRWSVSDYSMESEMIANVGKHNIKYTEISVKTIYLSKYKGTTIIDGLKIIINMIWWRLR